MFTDVVEELVGLPDGDLEASIRELELRRRADTALMACAIAVADARQLNAVDGHRTMKGYLRATCAWSNHEVAKMRSLARLVDRHADVGDALSVGRIGGPQAFELAKVHGNRRVVDRFGEFLPKLLRAAEALSYDDFRIAVQRFTLGADPDGAHRDDDASIANRDARMVEIDGSVDFRMTGGDRLVTSELLSIFNNFVDAEFDADLAVRRAAHGDAAESHELPRTGKQRRHDASVAIFRAAHAAAEAGRTSDPLVNIIVDAGTFARVMADAGLASDVNVYGDDVDPFTGLADTDDLLNGLTSELTADLCDDDLDAGHDADDLGRVSAAAVSPDLESLRCETTNGVVLHPHHLLRAALSGHVRRVVIDSAGVIIDQGRKQRLFTGSARQAAMMLVKHCEHPGCDLPAQWCQVDHANEWTDGGVTDQANARARCGGHNRDKHRKKLKSKRATNGRTYTIRSDGSVMLPVGARKPIFADDDSEIDVDDPAEIIRLTKVARQRLTDLPRPDG